MLDLEFINNSAPALNAANLNRIVNEINENEKKIKDVQAEVVELVVTHGGSIVQANPEAEKEGTLNKISIDGHVFDFYQENQISDWQVSEDYTWSSQHIKDELDEKADTTVISTLAKDVNADDDIWMYTYTDDPDDIVVSDIVIGTTNAIKKLNQNVNTLAARDSDFKASLNYRKVGEADGQNVIALPSSFNELYVIISNGTAGVRFSSVIPYDEIASTSRKYNLGGYYYSSSNYGYAEADVNKSQIKVNYLVDSGSVKTTTAHIIVYVK